MDPQRRRATILATAAAGSVVLAALCVLGLVLGRGSTEPTIWRGYDLVLAEESLPEAAVLQALSEGGRGHTLSKSTQPVEISDWARLESTTLSEALERLIPGDPRRDPYVERLASWFAAEGSGKRYRVLYVPRASGLIDAKPLRAALGRFGSSIVLPDEGAGSAADGSRPRWGAAAAAIVCALIVRGARPWTRPGLARAGRRAAVRAAVAAPWIFLAFGGQEAAVVCLLWSIALIESIHAIDLPLEELARGGAPRSALRIRPRGRALAAATAIPAIGSLLAAPEMAIPAGLALLASVCSLGAVVLLAVRRAERSARGRAPYVPVPIRGGRTRSETLPAALSAALVAAMLALRLWSSAAPEAAAIDVSFPLPRAAPGAARPGLEEARASWKSATGDLPGLGEWLAHRAIEESLPLARIGEPRADPFAPIELESPRDGAARVSFDESWAAAAYASIPSRSVEGMIRSQGRAVVGVRGSAAAREAGPLAPIEGLLYIFLLIPFFLRIIGGRGSARGARRAGLRLVA